MGGRGCEGAVQSRPFLLDSLRALQSFAVCLSISMDFKVRFVYVCQLGKVLLRKLTDT